MAKSLETRAFLVATDGPSTITKKLRQGTDFWRGERNQHLIRNNRLPPARESPQ